MRANNCAYILQLKGRFPTLAAQLMSLPQKDFFRSLESDVVTKRRQALEDYISKIVSSMPAVVRSEQFNEFLGIEERISAIRSKLITEDRDLNAQSQARQRQISPNHATEAAVEAAMGTEEFDESNEVGRS
jgi:hypothetical protein